MSAIQKAEQLPTIRQDESALLSVISRAASDPGVDISKMERLMDMYERIQRKQSAVEFDTAMAEMQSELPAITERGNAAGRYTYALWEDINTAIKPVLQKFGFALSFRTNFDAGISVTAVLSHRSGHREETSIVLPSDKSGNKNDVQAVASSVSYGKRYTAGALLNLTSHGEDDDAYQAGGGYDITEWADEIKSAETVADLQKIAAKLKNRTIPAAPLKNIRALWSKRSKELK